MRVQFSMHPKGRAEDIHYIGDLALKVFPHPSKPGYGLSEVVPSEKEPMVRAWLDRYGETGSAAGKTDALSPIAPFALEVPDDAIGVPYKEPTKLETAIAAVEGLNASDIEALKAVLGGKGWLIGVQTLAKDTRSALQKAVEAFDALNADEVFSFLSVRGLNYVKEALPETVAQSGASSVPQGAIAAPAAPAPTDYPSESLSAALVALRKNHPTKVDTIRKTLVAAGLPAPTDAQAEVLRRLAEAKE